MKKIIILLLATILFTACEYDNYDAPSVTFSGQLLYNDKPFLCDGNDARDIFLFFQEGLGKADWGTKMHTLADGSYQQLLHSGEY